MFKPALCAAALIAAAFTLTGCLGEGKPADDTSANPATTTGTPTATAVTPQGHVQMTPAQIVDKLKAMSAEPEKHGDKIDRHIYTQQLASMGPTELAPLLNYMAAPDTPQTARLFILQCVNNYLTPVYLSNLKPLVDSTDEGARAMGLTAIAHIKDPSVVEALKAARNDASQRIQFCALAGLAIQGEPDAKADLKKMYTDDTAPEKVTVEQVKREVVRVILRDVQPDDVSILQDALNQPYIEPNARLMIVEALGRLGDASAVPLLEQSLNLQKELQYEEMVKQAIAAINQRAAQAA